MAIYRRNAGAKPPQESGIELAPNSITIQGDCAFAWGDDPLRDVGAGDDVLPRGLRNFVAAIDGFAAVARVVDVGRRESARPQLCSLNAPFELAAS